MKPGDTLIRIGLDTVQSPKDLARWNGLDNPNLIEVGQVLRVVPPTVSEAPVALVKPATAPRPDTKPPEVKPTEPKPSDTRPTDGKPAVVEASPGKASAADKAGAAGKEADDAIQWVWPATGAVLAGFDEKLSKGVLIGGKEGDTVSAAADGRVIYVGAGVRGLGNLLIIKHNSTYLTAYAHNRQILVKEDQNVKRGQKVAEMGASDAERVQLHFEVRRLGKPVDPTKLLPAR